MERSINSVQYTDTKMVFSETVGYFHPMDAPKSQLFSQCGSSDPEQVEAEVAAGRNRPGFNPTLNREAIKQLLDTEPL